MAILTSSHRRIAAVTLALTCISTPALAQDLSPITTFFNTLGTAITGPVGRALGVVAIAGAGLAFMAGRMNWMILGSILIGLVLVFGAATILGGM